MNGGEESREVSSPAVSEQLTEQVMRELNAIIDPCSAAAGAPAGLVDMGMVREATLQPLEQGGFRAQVRISVTHPFCMMAGIFLGEIEKRLRALPGVAELDAAMDTSTLWKPALMSAEYRVRLDAVRLKARAAT